MEYQSELRVYQPLAAFPDAVQAGFLRARHLTRAAAEEEASRRAWRRLLRDVTDPFPHGSDLVRVLRVPVSTGTGRPDPARDPADGPGKDPAGRAEGRDAGAAPVSEYFCPDEMALRCELAAEQLAESMRPQTFNLVVPEAARRANLERLAEHLEEDGPEELRHVHTRTAVWGVPASWFALVHEDDTIDVETDGGSGPDGDVGPVAAGGAGGAFDAGSVRSVRITVPLALALERARRAAVVLSLHAPDMDLLSDLTILVAWLESFHPDSMVELDYGGLARLVWPDDSPFDVRTALEALEDGDQEAAVVANHRMVRRWLPVRQLGRAS
jgi:hypothetical protein